MHIKSIGFKSIRQLNASMQDHHHDYSQAFEHLPRLKLGRFNLLIGENGAGKSTVIDMIRALNWPDVLPTLARDNPEFGCTPEFCIEFEDGSAYLYRFVASPTDETFQKIICKIGYRPVGGHFEKIAQKLLDRFSEQPAKGKIRPAELVQIEYLNCGGSSLDVNAQALENLNVLAELLTGVIDWKLYTDSSRVPLDGNAINALEDGIVSTWLRNQCELGQPRMDMPNNVKVSSYPSGWKACAAILHWLSHVQEKSICLLEEPEVHIHPKLQRRMFEQILEIAEKKALQLVISTHSAALINAAISSEVNIFQAQGQKVVAANITQALDRLGYQAADLLQANCVIWVEGPSDRMYLNSWLLAKDSRLKEGLHYSIMFYGGRLVSHLTASQTPLNDLISLRRLNRNSAILIDSDRASLNEPLKQTKSRLQEEFSDGNGRGLAWVTAGREIENYLDETAFRASLRAVHHNVMRMIGSGRWANLLKYEVDSATSRAKSTDPQRTGNKVEVASHYLQHNAVNLKILDLDQRLDDLCDFIRASNT
ncbi:ATP-dependent nuclease [Pseudomonas syringae]|uniref:ATP-dependent nuclease n=1 Tax=Pseudomonas syringae TaxID=317 RepID=UPI003F82F90A